MEDYMLNARNELMKKIKRNYNKLTKTIDRDKTTKILNEITRLNNEVDKIHDELIRIQDKKIAEQNKRMAEQMDILLKNSNDN
jgi:uncharacterized protein Yka (UPF0111/DUF47 family)